MAMPKCAEGEYNIGELPYSERRRIYERNRMLKRAVLYVAPALIAGGMIAGSLYFARSAQPGAVAPANTSQSTSRVKSKSIEDAVIQGTTSTKEEKPAGQQPADMHSDKGNYL